MPTTKFTTLANLNRYTTHVEERNVQVTRNEYTNLPSSKLTDNISYFIKDEGVVIKNGVEYGGNSAGDTTYTLSVGTGADADKIVLTPSSGTPDVITVPYAANAGSASNASSVSGHTVATDVPADAVFTDTTYENATTAVAGLMSTADKSKLNGIASGAEVNQNAFSNIVANGTTVSADSKTDTLIIEAGSNVTITGDATADKITISATDTTYSDATTATHGLMSTTDKSKLDGIAAGAEVNVQANWTETSSSSDAYIKNKPTLGTAAAKDVPATGNASSTQVVMGNDTRLSDARNAADVYSWAKASTKPTYSYSEITDTPTIPTITDTYSGTSSDGMSGKAVKSAIDALDGTITGTAGAGKTLTALSQTNGKVSATFGNISITKSQVSDFPSLGNAAAKNYTTSVTNGSSDLVTSGAVWTAIDNLPEPMVFKGSLGTGGTITALPVDGSAAIGDTYKVITAGTYASKAAKVGDTFICLTKTSSANTWELIPSGDEPSGTVTSVGVSNGGGLSVSGSPVTTSGTITISHADTSSQASVNNSGRTYIQDITLDTYGHVTGIASATETVTNTDRYVNAASFAHDSTNDNVKMTLTRAGSDTATVTGNIPKVSSSSAGVAPKGAAVSSQTQTTKFLREDGTWAAPSYTTNTNTTYTFANGTNGFTVTPSGGTAQTVNVTPSVSKSDVGLGSVANIDQSKAIKSITRSGTTFTATALDGTTSSFTQQDNNTTYGANNGVGLSGTTFYNTGVRSIAQGTSNGTINVNTNGSTANVAVKGLGSAAYTDSGSYATNTTLTNQDLNNVTAPGFYNAGGGNTCANKPSGIDAFGLEVIHSAGGTYYTQIIYSNTSSVPYRRNCNNGTWSSWTLDKYTDTNTTYSAGSNITLSGTQFSLTKANVTGALGYTPPTTNTTYSNVSTSAAGLAPKVTDTSKFLKGDGTWATPTNTTYSNVSTSAAGLAPKITNTANFLKGDGTWTMPTKANVGLGNVANYDQSKAIKSITRSGTTFTATALDGTTSSFTQQDNNTWTALVGATSAANGSVGYINAAPPKDGYNTKYFRADGTWAVPPNTKYTASTISVGSASAGTAIPADDITAWSAGTAASASVANGVLTITNGTAPSLSYTAKSIPNISVASKTVVTGITAS